MIAAVATGLTSLVYPPLFRDTLPWLFYVMESLGLSAQVSRDVRFFELTVPLSLA